MDALMIGLGIAIGVMVIAGVGYLSFRHPSRSVRRSRANWEDTNSNSLGDRDHPSI